MKKIFGYYIISEQEKQDILRAISYDRTDKKYYRNKVRKAFGLQ